MEFENEVWKDVEGFEGTYQVSNLGRIKSFKKDKNGKILKQTNKKNDYFRIVLKSSSNEMHTSVHRLVATHFIPNPDNLPVVNHIDGNKQNNRESNLEWCTVAYNTADARRRNPGYINGMINYNKRIRPKPVTKCNMDGTPIATYSSAKFAGESTGICARNILQTANRTPNEHGYIRKSAGGFKWVFFEEVTSLGL